MQETKLNVGCGRDIREGFVNMDKFALPGVDVVHDLAKLPLPFTDGSFTVIVCQDVLEHVDYPPVLGELHRILCEGGELLVRVPHFTSRNNFIDPTHVRQFSILTFDFFLRDALKGRDYYFPFAFSRITRRRITFERGALFWNRLLEPLVNMTNRAQRAYEATGVSRLFPAENIELVLIK